MIDTAKTSPPPEVLAIIEVTRGYSAINPVQLLLDAIDHLMPENLSPAEFWEHLKTHHGHLLPARRIK
jgi:hypothetical protein